MTAGIPGTGIGGLFYMASAVWLGVRGIFRRTLKINRLSHLRMVLPLVCISIGTFTAIWLTGWLLGLAVPVQVIAKPHISGDVAKSVSVLLINQNVVRWYMLGFAVITLLVVLAGVEVLRLVIEKRNRKRLVQGANIS